MHGKRTGRAQPFICKMHTPTKHVQNKQSRARNHSDVSRRPYPQRRRRRRRGRSRKGNEKYFSDEKSIKFSLSAGDNILCFHHVSVGWWGWEGGCRNPAAVITTSQLLSQIPSCCTLTDTTLAKKKKKKDTSGVAGELGYTQQHEHTYKVRGTDSMPEKHLCNIQQSHYRAAFCRI